MITVCYIAVNTTRLRGAGDIIELAGYAPHRTDTQNELYVSAVCPVERIRPDAGALLGWDNDPRELRVAPSPEAAVAGLAAWLPPGDVLLVGYHLGRLDERMKQAAFKAFDRTTIVGRLCLHRLAHHLLTPSQLAFGSTPQVLVRILELAIPAPGAAFRARDEVLFQREVYRALLHEMESAGRNYDLQAQLELSQQPITYYRLPGAHPSDGLVSYRGLALSQTPHTELLRIMNGTQDQDLRRSIQRFIEPGGDP